MADEPKKEKKDNRGRKTKYEEAIVAQIEDQLKIGMGREDTCDIVSISQDTFYTWMKIHPEFSERVKKAEFVCKQRNIARIQNASRKDWHAAAWWLERKFYKEFGRKDRFEHVGPDGEPLSITTRSIDLSNVTEENLVAFVKAVDKIVAVPQAETHEP